MDSPEQARYRGNLARYGMVANYTAGFGLSCPLTELAKY